MKIKTLLLAAAGVISMLSGNASAALISLDGDGFTAIYDDTALGLFGTPTLSGDGKSVLFSPLNFKAQSTGNVGTVFANSNVQFDIKTDSGLSLSGVNLVENGDYRLINRSGSVGLAPAVDASGQLRLTNLWNGIDYIASGFSAGLLTNTCSTSSNCPLSVWSASATLSTPTVWGNADVRVRIQNDLTAESFIAGDSALIEKKQSTQSLVFTPFIEGGTTAVPVPGAAWLFGSALVGLMGLRRKVSA
ncbi:hypothetical protein [Methylomonas albis]|uniref:Secreted protein n=1 Tax=Methylomonas albis TaxID=1854563 RepID=A0ABR9CVB1_9GAMM|nr:hypothetical protein [Methylomonas albis]MBD9354779.1 hypothetical protein [Methylomonas albis]CAD6877683.1 hypothetical protein [Methylomonas albis]